MDAREAKRRRIREPITPTKIASLNICEGPKHDTAASSSTALSSGDTLANSPPPTEACCDRICDDDCQSEECFSCHEDDACCASCGDVDSCLGQDCTDEACFDHPECYKLDDCRSSHISPVAPPFFDAAQHEFVNPRQLMLDCHWEDSTGHHCDASRTSYKALSQHILQDHIQPQRTLPCQWSDCSNSISADEIADHVWRDHSPISKADSYVCLWHGCGEMFDAADDLDAHMKSVHCQVNCHWNGCEQVKGSELALKAHVDSNHLRRTSASQSSGSTVSTASVTTPGSPEVIAPSMVKQQCEEADPHFHFSLGVCPTPRKSGKVARNSGHKECLWNSGSGICGQVFANGNKLQKHIETCHLPEFKAAGDSAQANTCHWEGCKTRTPFSERSKLARHIYTHTKFTIGACRYCSKEFSNHNQLIDHERTHTKEKPFCCPECDFKASNKAALTTHMRTHTGEKPLKCDKCSYTCGDPSNMSKHRKTHEKPLHKCDVCGRAFCRMATLRRHILSHS